MKKRVQAAPEFHLNSNQEKLLRKLYAVPTPADFGFSDLSTLLNAFRFDVQEGAGSRVIFYDSQKDNLLRLHKPHPQDEMQKAAVRDVRDSLLQWGYAVEI